MARRRRRAEPSAARTDVESLVFRWGPAVDPDLLDLALTHRSWAHENGGLPNNERLEFLGDSVLGLVVTESLYRDHPDMAEGQLAKLRAAVVNMRALASVARGLGVGDYLLLGRKVTQRINRRVKLTHSLLQAVHVIVQLSTGVSHRQAGHVQPCGALDNAGLGGSERMDFSQHESSHNHSPQRSGARHSASQPLGVVAAHAHQAPDSKTASRARGRAAGSKGGRQVRSWP